MDQKEICLRLKNYRIAYPLTQKELADKAGLSLNAIKLMESGNDLRLSNLIKILAALDLDKNLELLIPDVTKRPSYQIMETSAKKRVRKKTKKETTFVWGEDR